MDEGKKFRKWKDWLASGNERVTLYKINDTAEIYYNPGSAYYYMNDMKEYETFNHLFPNALFFDSKGEYMGIISAEQLLKEYNIKLISWEYTPPIKNSFFASKKKDR